MTRSLLVGLSCLALSACGGDAPDAPATGAPAAGTDDPNAAAVHADTLTLDSHVDIPLRFATDAHDPLDVEAQVNLTRMRRGGLDAAFFIVYVGQAERTTANTARAKADAMTKFTAIRRMTDEMYSDRIGLAESPDELERIVESGRLAAAIGVENGFAIGDDLSLLNQYHALGARYMTLVHNGHNAIADSAQPRPELGDAEAEHAGLSEFGGRVVARMNELGMLVDISHASKAAALDAIRASRAPVIASHSSVNALTDHARNLDDETLRALAENGGVVQIVAFDPYLVSQPPERAEAMAELRERLDVEPPVNPDALPADKRTEYLRRVGEIDERFPPAAIDDLVDHIDYAVDLVGIDHVGISSDFGGGGGIVGWTNAAETPNVTAELVSRGYTPREIEQLWGGNLLRAWREAERVAVETP